MYRFLTSSVLALLLTAQMFSNCVPTSARLHPFNEEEYEVYAAVIRKLFAGNKVTFDTNSPVSLLVIKNLTVTDNYPFIKNPDDHWNYLAERLPPISQETIAAYKSQNRTPRRLEDIFKLPFKHVLVEEKELEQFRKERGWEEFYKKYPESGGFISFSQVGFNPERNQALVYFEHWCGGLCGSGIYLLLEKGKEDWNIVKFHRSWIS